VKKNLTTWLAFILYSVAFQLVLLGIIALYHLASSLTFSLTFDNLRDLILYIFPLTLTAALFAVFVNNKAKPLLPVLTYIVLTLGLVFFFAPMPESNYREEPLPQNYIYSFDQPGYLLNTQEGNVFIAFSPENNQISLLPDHRPLKEGSSRYSLYHLKPLPGFLTPWLQSYKELLRFFYSLGDDWILFLVQGLAFLLTIVSTYTLGHLIRYRLLAISLYGVLLFILPGFWFRTQDISLTLGELTTQGWAPWYQSGGLYVMSLFLLLLSFRKQK